MKLIPDSNLLRISIRDNGEKLVDIKKHCPKVLVRVANYIIKDGDRINARLVREDIVNRLNNAQSDLPEGFRLLIRCGYRSLKSQTKRYNWMYLKIKKRHPDYSEEKLKEETSKNVAPIDIIPPHSTGGAVDLSIVDCTGRNLDMGTKLGEFNEKTYTDFPRISETARKNRKLLISIMTRAGFVNYPTEWWHWSYGDRYWAAVLKKKCSIYDGK